MSSDNQTRYEMESLLENWGEWCYINPDKLLQIPQQPMFRYYQSGGEKPMPRKPINDLDAEIANAAILHIRIKECPFDEAPKGFFSIYDFIVLKWAYKMPVAELAEFYKCVRKTIYNRKIRAIDEFTEEYMNIVRSTHVKTK